jgi:hypothetical protein
LLSDCDPPFVAAACDVLCIAHPAVSKVVAGAPGSRLVDLVVAPQVLVQQDSSRAALRLNGTYYITKQVAGWDC